MRFERCVWTWRSLKGWSPQRIAAAKRAVAKEAARVEAARDQVGLFPELQAEIQPDFTTVEERQQDMDAREVQITRKERAQQLAQWRQARAAYFSLPPLRRAGALRLWQRQNQPASPYALAEFVTRYSQPGQSPWTYLRKLRMMVLWNHHGMPKPPHFRDIVQNFQTLGPVRSPRLRTQTLLAIAKLRGQSLRTVAAEFSNKIRTIQGEL